MAQRIGSLIISLALESGAFRSGLDASEKDLRKATKRMEALGESMRGIGERLSLAVTAPLAAFAGFSVKVASDAAELQSAFNQTFGSMSKGMDDWARATGDAMGRSTQEMQRAANTFGLFFNQAAPTKQAAADMSKAFAVLAQDLSSFYNVDVQTAIDKLRSGLAGESEPLRDFGVFLTEAAVKAKAMEMGLGGANGELSEQAKIMARYQLIMEATKNAQGDVARTSDGLANRARATKAALEELQVSVGNKLQPVMLKLLDVADKVLTAFTSLPDGAQTFVLVLAGLAAAAGPVLMGLGAIVSTLAPLSGALTTVAAGGLSAFTASLVALGATIAGALPVIAAVAAIGGVIYANWDRIGPVFAELGSRISDTLGPQVQALIASFGQVLTELWQGPLGDLLREVIKLLGSLAIGLTKIFGEALIVSVSAALEVLRGFFQYLANVIKFVGQILTGDFVGAWETAKTAIVQVARSLVNALSIVLTGDMDKIWNWVTGKIEVVRKAFFNLYDAVVGHSYIPDMVDGIAAQMARLDATMVSPTKKATDATAEAFKKLADEVQPILDRLFPEARALLDYQGDLGVLNRAEKNGAISSNQAEEAIRRLRGLGADYAPEISAMVIPDGFELAGKAMERARAELDLLYKAANDNGEKVGAVNVRIAKGFKEMADETVSALQGLAGSIKNGGFLDILGSVVNLLTQLGSIGVFGKKIQTNINKPVPGYAGGTSYHPGGLALVGERGPELVSLPRGSSVTPNHVLRGGGGGGSVAVQVIPSPYFDVRVNQNIDAAAPGIASAGGAVGVRRTAYRNSRRLA